MREKFIQQLREDNDLLLGTLVVEVFSQANTNNLIRAAQLANTNVLASKAVRSTHLASLRQMTALLTHAMTNAQSPPKTQTIEGFKAKAMNYVGAIEFLFRFEEVMTLLDQHLTNTLIPKREEMLKGDTAAGAEPSSENTPSEPPGAPGEPEDEQVEPTLALILGTDSVAFRQSFRQVFAGTHVLTKTPQEHAFQRHVKSLQGAVARLMPQGLRVKFVEELIKITVPEAQDLLQKLGPALYRIRQAKTELGSAKPENLAQLFGVPSSVLVPR